MSSKDLTFTLSNGDPVLLSEYVWHDGACEYALDTDTRWYDMPNSDDTDILQDELVAMHYGCLDSMLVRELEHEKWAYSEYPHEGSIPA